MKQDFKIAVVSTGDVPKGCGDVRAWLGELENPFTVHTLQERRLVNRYSIGADPEFVVADATGRTQIAANLLHLTTGRMIGADSNGRLIEARPKPSRSTLRVVANIGYCLHWLCHLSPDTRTYKWMAGAYKFRDGLGGHVHFGRKRSSRPDEIEALNALHETLLGLGVFNQAEQKLRTAGDAHHQHYGQINDYRLQLHGYEYRTFPSWLNSPEQAFLVLTLAKLAVFEPTLLHDWPNASCKKFSLIRRLLGLYQGVDDDARLCLNMLDRMGLPVPDTNADLKGAWGITAQPQVLGTAMPTYFPNTAAAPEGWLEAYFNRMLKGVPIPVWKSLSVTWSPTTLPPGIKSCEAAAGFNMGELFNSLCMSEGYKIEFQVQGGKKMLGLYHPHANRREEFKAKARELFDQYGLEVYAKDDGNYRALTITRDLLKAHHIPLLRKLLTSGLFPIWKATQVRPDSYEIWKAMQTQRLTPKAAGIDVLYQKDLKGLV
jgi:hypothetical protein